ncbi:hypothetical protein DFP72DRAFT_1072158 [Ephemerocybe angulata]|uniref:Uncharacterized protein n=1 Tax=Ephemerocybe angulata TaxID=980116 RepID=A0A8H6HPE4_9AGAR|nr:hypothetical protein DFP72DRAFT_1072158 [Tulosesus angulatus]
MSETGTILSGSAALKIAVPGSCNPTDLNMYCPKGTAKTVAQYFLENPDIRRVPLPVKKVGAERTPFSKFDVNRGVRKIYLFHHTITGKVITLCESIAESPLVPLLFFHASFVMNYVSGHDVVCLYSALTENYSGLSNLHPEFTLIHKPGQNRKWISRGFDVHADCSYLHSIHATVLSGVEKGACQWASRRSDDRWIARVSFQVCPVGSPVSPIISWQLGRRVTEKNGIMPGVVQVAGDKWYMNTFRPGGVWVEYYAPVDRRSGKVVSAWWKRSFP